MNKLSVLIVDDEFLAINILESYIKKIENFTLIAKTQNPIEAIQILNSFRIDVLFLDIEMPDLTGINLLKSLPQKPITVFTTAYQNYALNAFNLNAIDYLLKPFSFDRFLQAVNKINQIKNQNIKTKIPQKKFITIKSDGKMIKLALQDILFIEGMREYIKIQCLDKSFLVLERMKNIEKNLDTNFIRCHKSFIIAIDKVESLNGNLLKIKDYRIPVSREKKEKIIRIIF